MAIHHFLLLHSLLEHKLLVVKDFGADRRSMPTECEATYRGAAGVEIVLIGADSLDTVRQTHAHYFEGDLGRDFFESVVPAGVE
jgi:hypothetical protein